MNNQQNTKHMELEDVFVKIASITLKKNSLDAHVVIPMYVIQLVQIGTN